MEKFKELAEELLTIPIEVKDLQMQLLDLNEKSQEQLDAMHVIESVIKTEIASELDEKGKKVYSNDGARNAAFIERSAENNELYPLRDLQKDLQRRISELRLDIEMASNHQRNIRSILDFIGKVGE